MMIGTGVLAAWLFCAAFGGLTAAAAVRHQRAYNRKRLLTQVLKQLGDGEQLCGEITQASGDGETLGAVCCYNIAFSGTDGLSRRIAMPVRLDLDNRYELGTTMLLRMAPVPIEPLLLPLNAPEQQFVRCGNVTAAVYPMDATGRVLLESDFFALKNYLLAEKKKCSRAIVKYGLATAFAGLDLFSLLLFLIYLLGL